MAGEEAPWTGLIEDRPDAPEGVLDTILGPSEGGGSHSFPARLADGRRLYVKAPNNPQGGRVPVTEVIVSGAGRMIGAPVCEVLPVVIPAAMGGYAFPSGFVLDAGIGSGSIAVGDAVEDRALSHRDADDNARRHAGVFALHDWCWGGDPQWLYVETADKELFSHDHGWYFPPEGPDWTADSLRADLNTPHELALDPAGLDPDELERLAVALDGVTRDDLASLLSSIPSSWPVTDEELEAVGEFLEIRAPEVAGRIRALRAKL